MPTNTAHKMYNNNNQPLDLMLLIPKYVLIVYHVFVLLFCMCLFVLLVLLSFDTHLVCIFLINLIVVLTIPKYGQNVILECCNEQV